MPEPTRYSEITPEEAIEMVESGAFLLDVREDHEWTAGHSPGANHIAIGLISEKVDEIPTDRAIVCVCLAGGRSSAVAGALANAGFEVHNLSGGMAAWAAADLPVVTDSGEPGRII